MSRGSEGRDAFTLALRFRTELDDQPFAVSYIGPLFSSLSFFARGGNLFKEMGPADEAGPD